MGAQKEPHGDEPNTSEKFKIVMNNYRVFGLWRDH